MKTPTRCRPPIWWLAGLALLLTLPACKYLGRQIIESAAVAYVLRWAGVGTVQKEGLLKDGLQTGEWTYYYQDGRRRAKGPYKNDRQFGRWTYWYENGNREWEGEFDAAGHRTGSWTYFYTDGKRKAAGRFADDGEVGAWEFWHPSGELSRRGDYSSGRAAGFWEHFYADGKPQASGFMHNGDRVGLWSFVDRAEVASTRKYPLPSGCELVRENWPSGKLRRAGIVQNGRQVGRWTCWHENGERRISCDVVDGKPVGAFEVGREDGRPLATGLVQNAELRGASAFVGEGMQPIERGPLPQVPPATGDWTAGGIADREPVESVIAKWINELTDATIARAAPKVVQPDAPKPTAKQEADVKKDPRVPPSFQPGFTVLEKAELSNTVKNFLIGQSKARKPKKRYRARLGADGKAAQRRRTDLENRPLAVTKFVSTTGETVDLTAFRGKKRVLVVVLRGFSGQVCVYCVAQTEALAQSRKAFADLDLEVMVIYPGPENGQEAFLDAYKLEFKHGPPPYRVFYDPDLTLVNALGIKGGDLAYPTSIILDKQGQVRYAYTGQHRADRPAVKTLVKFIEGMKQ